MVKIKAQSQAARWQKTEVVRTLGLEYLCGIEAKLENSLTPCYCDKTGGDEYYMKVFS